MAIPGDLKELNNARFDYIIVGGGTSGCLLASRIASAPQETPFTVLVIEAGGEAEEDPENLIPGLVVSKFGNEAGNWLYETAPQRELNNRTIVYPRGRGLGGCSANNFSSWVRGPACDFDDWAAAVGDPWWRSENVVREMIALEDFCPDVPDGMEKWFQPVDGMHQAGGPIGVGPGAQWQDLVEPCLKGAVQAGHKLNLDHNGGEQDGISVAQMNVDHGIRRSSAAAFLSPETQAKLSNLTVLARSICSRIVLKGKRAVGVEILPAKAASTDNDKPAVIFANEEVILTAGTFETPHILLLSGIGPSDELSKHAITIQHDLPSVGQNIRDHSAFALEFLLDRSLTGQNNLLRDEAAMAAARRQYDESHTGPLATYGASAAMLFTRIPELYLSAEFGVLDPTTQAFLQRPERPSTELWMHGGPQFYAGMDLEADDAVLAIEGLCQNLLSRGKLTLRSANPRDPPLIDPAYCTSAYDWRVAIETVKVQLQLVQSPALQEVILRPLLGPGKRGADGTLQLCEPEDEDAIREFLCEHLTQGFHSLGSCVMGKSGDSKRVVDAEFKVDGLEGLRLADMSVCPVLTNNHTQINAYLIAERCAQVMLGPLGVDR